MAQCKGGRSATLSSSEGSVGVGPALRLGTTVVAANACGAEATGTVLIGMDNCASSGGELDGHAHCRIERRQACARGSQSKVAALVVHVQLR